MSTDSDWFERIWEYREESLYPRLFGTARDGIYSIPWARLKKGGISDPRWSTCGVLKFAPTSARSSWLFVSSGLSNAWFDEAPDANGVSGFGCEFILETDQDAEWPIQRIHQFMVYQIGLCVGICPGYQVLDYGFRVPLGSPIDFANSDLMFALLVEPESFVPELKQESGSAALLQMIGITEVEREFAKMNGNDALVDLLRRQTSYPVTTPARKSLIS